MTFLAHPSFWPAGCRGPSLSRGFVAAEAQAAYGGAAHVGTSKDRGRNGADCTTVARIVAPATRGQDEPVPRSDYFSRQPGS